MDQYLVQVAYDLAAPGIAARVQDPVEAVRPVAESLGGRIQGSWHSAGEWNVVAIVELPESPSRQALFDAFGARAVKNVEARMLISREAGLMMPHCPCGLPSVTGDCTGACGR